MTRYILVLSCIAMNGCGSNKNDSSSARLRMTEAQLSSEDIAYEAWQVVLEHLDGLEGDDYSPLAQSLPQHWRAVYTTFWLEAEVNNGGHHQFFWNSDGALNKETLEDLKYIGADPFVSVFDEALRIYEKHDYQAEKQATGDSWEGFTEAYREKRMEELDNKFYEQKRTIANYLEEHIRRNRDLYLKGDSEG